MGKAKIKNIVIAEVIAEVPASIPDSVQDDTPVDNQVSDSSSDVPAEVEAIVVAPKVSLVSRILQTINSNQDKSMKEVCDIMVATLPLNPERALASARSYYQELVAAGRAFGHVEPQKRMTSTPIKKTNQDAIPEKTPEVTPEVAMENVQNIVAKLQKNRKDEKAA